MDKHREMKEAYKQIKIEAGIYQVKNKTNGKILIGASPNLAGMFNRLRFDLTTHGRQVSPALQKDWDETGADNFSFEILDVLKREENGPTDFQKELVVLEALWLEKLQPFEPRGYNVKPRPA
jgi:hypothetical protein